MRAIGLAFFFFFAFGTAGYGADDDRPLVEPDFTVPDLSDQVALLEQRFLALSQHLRAMEQRLSREGVDERLDEIFLPEEPGAFKSHFRIELRIARTGGDLADWWELAEHALTKGALDDAMAAAFRVTRDSPVDRQRAGALALMAEAALAKGELRLAINLYHASLGRFAEREVQQRFNVLIERHDLRIKDLAIDSERRLPGACVVLTQNLAKKLPLPVQDYLDLEPAADIDISARDNRICFRGLSHGGDYEVRLRPGLLGAEGARLHGTVERRFQVPDRTPRILLAKGSYVLPKTTTDGLPVKTVNLDSIALKLYRIDDRNLAVPILSGQMDDDLYSGSENAIEQTSGTLIWQGSLAVEQERNREITTLIPIGEVVPERKPGLYALVARPPEESPRERWQRHATQWLVLSDLGMVSFRGEDGLHLLARSLESARPLARVTWSLVARNNVVLGTALGDDDGLAHFPPGLLRGQGGDRPAFVTAATDGGDYNFLRLVGAALDLSERGIGGRTAPKGPDAFVYSERGVYRPGETVYLSVLLRDGRAEAKGGLPLTVKVVRPGAVEVYHQSAKGDDLGGYLFQVPLSAAARAGTWTATAHLDPEEAPVGTASFQVEDFVPPRLESTLATETPWLAPGASADVVLTGRFLYGAAAADLATEARVAQIVDPRPFPAFADYHFGLEQEDYRPRRQTIESARTDQDGQAVIRLTLEELPDTSHPLVAELRASLLDLGGRPVDASLRLPIRTRDVEVGLRPRAVNPEGETVYDLVALDPAGEPVPGRRVAYEWLREIYDYSWYQQNGEWKFRTTVYDEVVAAGETELDHEGRGRLARRLGNGRYRLEVFDPDSGSAASHRFFAGWWYGPPAPDVPDALELSLEETSLSHGDTLKAFVRAPFTGAAVVTVMNDRLRHRLTLDLPEAGAEISVPVDGAWGPGAYLMVTAFRPDDGTPSPVPTRAMGLAWFAIDRDARSLKVAIETPESVLPRQTMELPITVTGAGGGEPIKLTLAAVDEGILQLTNYASPRPDDYFLGQRRLAVDIRDLYGRLIRPAEGQRGRLRSGGDKAALENLQGVSLRTVKTVALYQRDILPDDQGRATVALDLPDFNGRLRLMAVAYGKTRIGGGEAPLVVRDPLIADLLLPRFLALSDQAQVTLDLHNLSGAAQSLDIAVSAEGAVALAGESAFQLSLEADARRSLSLTLEGARVGEGSLGLSVTGEGLAAIERSWDIAVRPAQPYVTRREVQYLEPGDRVALTASSFSDVLAETLAANLTVTAGTDFNLPELLDSLDRYPYGCTEQTISRALPLLYYGDLAQGAGRERGDQDSQRKVDRSIRRILERQRSDGSFAVWQSFGTRHPWLTAYAFDFLTRSREAGYDVPPAAYEHTLTWLRNYAERDGNDRHTRAYAYYVLARVGQAKAGSLRYFAETHGGKIRTRLGLGHLAAGLAILGEGERAEVFFEKAIAQRRPKGVHFADYGSDLRDGWPRPWSAPSTGGATSAPRKRPGWSWPPRGSTRAPAPSTGWPSTTTRWWPSGRPCGPS
jgi:uncharacterized protein YfaS (alpha-2-macroglobulin family)